MDTDIANRALTWAAPGAWSLGLTPKGCPGPGPRPGPGPDQGQVRQPWALAHTPGADPAHASALLAIYVYAYAYSS